MGERSSLYEKKNFSDEAEEALIPKSAGLSNNSASTKNETLFTFHRAMALLGLILSFGLLTSFWPLGSLATQTSCNTVERGYNCKPAISHQWGQYSPFFSVPSAIRNQVPDNCEITFAQVLSRHGARDPTASKTAAYNATITQLKQNVTTFSGKYAFLANYTYTLGADQLTTFGQQEMVDSGITFFNRYSHLTSKQIPFFRASSEARVVESAMNFTQGFHAAKAQDPSANPNDGYPYNILIISEAAGSNNTLNHGLCTNFEDGPDSEISGAAQANWTSIFVPPIQARLNNDLPGAKFSTSQVIYMMDLCPFNTVASVNETISPFCNLFSDREWQQYAYYESLGKFYGYGSGNPLGPTQGVGFTNELIARMTGKPVQDETSTNHTLDSNPATFPIGPGHDLFADFSHDNDMTGIFFALGLYNRTSPLSTTSINTVAKTDGYSAAWTVPFAARAYFEKMRCSTAEEELVRIIVNDRVVPLQNCGADKMGRCTLSAWVESLSFARSNGYWDQCFT